MRKVLMPAALALVALAARAESVLVGTEFWGCQMESADGAFPGTVAFQVVNPGTSSVTVTLEGNTGILYTVTVAPGGKGVLGQTVPERELFGTDQRPNAYRIASTGPIQAYQVNDYEVRYGSSDVSALIAVPHLGTRYYTINAETTLQTATVGEDGSHVGIVSVNPTPTHVTFVPTAPTRAGSIPATPAGQPIDLTLNAWDFVQIVADGEGSDFTGSLITSDQPIAVFGAAECAMVPMGTLYCDRIEEQLLPVSSWGTDFLAVRSPPRGLEPDFWRIVASQDGTLVTLSPAPIPSPVALNAGEWVSFSSPDHFTVSANHPVQVGQLLASSLYEPTMNTQGDPALTLMVPTDRFDTEAMFYRPPSWPTSWMSIVAQTGALVELDGAPLSPTLFTPIGSTSWSVARVLFPDSSARRVRSTRPLQVYAHGYGLAVGYGFFTAQRADVAPPPAQSCAAGGPYVACGDTVTLDGSASSAGASLLWTALTPGVVFADATAAVTDATVSGAGPWLVKLTAGSGASRDECIASITQSSSLVPAEVSGGSPAPWLLVSKASPDGSVLRFSFERRDGEVTNVYEGALTTPFTYTHEILACHLDPIVLSADRGELTLPVGAATRYYLVTASSCAAEGEVGVSSRGVERPLSPNTCR